MNQLTAQQLLVELGNAASQLSNICAREEMQQFAPFWASVAEAATALSPAPTRDGVHRLVREVLSEYRQVPGGFMDMYVVRADPDEQLRENDIFDSIRTSESWVRSSTMPPTRAKWTRSGFDERSLNSRGS